MSTIKTRTTLEKINILSKKTLDGLNLVDFTGQMFGVVDDDEALKFAETERQKSKNLFDKNNVLRGYSLQGDTGDVGSNSPYYVSDYIKVNGLESIYISSTSKTAGKDNCFYDENKNFIGLVSALIGAVSVPSGAFYMRFNGLLTELDNNIQVEAGDVATDYQAYNGAIVNEGYFYHRPKIELNKTIKDNDFIIETYLSSDGNTWYRKWASGWKECGGIFTATGTGLGESSGANVTLDFTLPISFSTTTYSVHLTNIWIGTGSHSVDWDSGGLGDKTINGFKLVAFRQYTHKGASDTVGCNWYCCGY